MWSQCGMEVNSILPWELLSLYQLEMECSGFTTTKWRDWRVPVWHSTTEFGRKCPLVGNTFIRPSNTTPCLQSERDCRNFLCTMSEENCCAIHLQVAWPVHLPLTLQGLTAEVTRDLLAQRQFSVMDLLANTPDMNPIEHVLDELIWRTHKQAINNLTYLEHLLVVEWIIWRRCPSHPFSPVKAIGHIGVKSHFISVSAFAFFGTILTLMPGQTLLVSRLQYSHILA